MFFLAKLTIILKDCLKDNLKEKFINISQCLLNKANENSIVNLNEYEERHWTS